MPQYVGPKGKKGRLVRVRCLNAALSRCKVYSQSRPSCPTWGFPQKPCIEQMLATCTYTRCPLGFLGPHLAFSRVLLAPSSVILAPPWVLLASPGSTESSCVSCVPWLLLAPPGVLFGSSWVLLAPSVSSWLLYWLFLAPAWLLLEAAHGSS